MDRRRKILIFPFKQKGEEQICKKSPHTYFYHIRKQLAEHFVFEVKSQALGRELSFLEKTKKTTQDVRYLVQRRRSTVLLSFQTVLLTV